MYKFTLKIHTSDMMKLEYILDDLQLQYMYDLDLSAIKRDQFGEIFEVNNSVSEQLLVSIFSTEKEFSSLKEHVYVNEIEYDFMNTVILNEHNYQQDYENSIKKIEFSHFSIAAPWHEKSIDDIVLLPGTGFGTGEHETTKLCISFLERCSLVRKTICDFGSGSGILSFSAAKLGAKKIYSVEIDEGAIGAFNKNKELNSFSNIKLVKEIDIIPQVDYTVMNVTLDIVFAYFDSVVSRTVNTIFLSGITIAQEEEIIIFLKQKNVNYCIEYLENWIGIEVIL